jgi:septal ring factor EnvC (AmiA/AmiB activator)
MKLIARRALVAAGVLASLVLGFGAIQAAAAWTASSAPLAPPAVTVESLQAQLQAERDRSSALQGQLDQLTQQATQLASALDTATARAGSDMKTADALRSQLKAAQAQLATLRRQLAAAARATPPPAAPPAGGGGAGGEGGDD